MDDLVRATVKEYGAPQDRAKGSNNLAANIFLHFKEVLNDFDFATTAGTSKVVFEPLGVVGIFTPWNSSAGSIAIKVAPAIAAGCTVVIKPSEMSAMQTQVLMESFHEAGLPAGVINFGTDKQSRCGQNRVHGLDADRQTRRQELTRHYEALYLGARRQIAEHHSGRRGLLEGDSHGGKRVLPQQWTGLHRGVSPFRS
jgi:hypothetical protein